jgi:hypothetical protein
MRYRSKADREPLRFLVALGMLVILMVATAAQTPSRGRKDPAPKAKLEQSKETGAEINGQKPQAYDKEATAARASGETPHASPAEKKRLAMSLLYRALAIADKIDPVEYSILVQVEAATMLWQINNEQPVSLLDRAVKTLRVLLDEERQSKEKGAASKNRHPLRTLAMRKIAALRPDLLRDLAADGSPNDKTKQVISGEWTQEARAVISVALDQIAKDPKQAARLAEQALPLGVVDWAGFLNSLGQRDAGEAERLATGIINRMRGSPIRPGTMYGLKRFVFAPDRSSELKELFLQSLATQLRQSIRPDKTAHELTGILYTARDAHSLAAAGYPNRQAEFAEIVSTIEAIFTERSLPVPGPPQVLLTLNPSLTSEVAPGDTQEISSAVPRVEAIKSSKVRDREYQQLATQAGVRTDFTLAESIASKIENEEIRRETTLTIYRPMVRKAISDSNWPYAQKLALNVLDPLGRTMLFDETAKAMAKAREDKSLVVDVYSLAAAKLAREEPTQRVAKAFLILAKSLLAIDREAGVNAAHYAVSTLNKITKEDEPLEEAPLGEAVSSVVSSPNFFLNQEDILILPDMLGDVLKEMAKRNVDESVTVADGLTHRGLHSLAYLAISKSLLEAHGSPDVGRKKKAVVKP